jgi:hypothetical protein
VTPPRPRSPGRPLAVRHRLLLTSLAIFAVAMASVACIAGEATTPAPSVAASLAPFPPSPSSSASTAPSAAQTEASTPVPTPSELSTASPDASPANAVDACTGTEDNRGFFADAAADLDWPVYCPALPTRWSVTTGNYRGQGIGQLTITYRGPGGATLSLHQGAFCDDGDGCVAAGTESGDAPFGDQSGTLVMLDGGGYALVVDRGAQPSWLAVGEGLDEATFRDFTASFIRLD